MQYNVIVFTQHLVIESLRNFSCFDKSAVTLFVSTHQPFENEKKRIQSIFSNCIFKTFADFIADAECEAIDQRSFLDYYAENDRPAQNLLGKYYAEIKSRKNLHVVKAIEKKYDVTGRYILNEDLGIDISVWLQNGYQKVELDYFWKEDNKTASKKTSTFLKSIRRVKYLFSFKHIPAYVGYKDGQKYIFHGKLSRVGYRINIDFNPSKLESYLFDIDTKLCKLIGRPLPRKVIHLSSFHEMGSKMPVSDKFEARSIQDGYLPVNYTSCYLKFFGRNLKYWTWDKMSLGTFQYFNLPAEIMPIRKKQYLPAPQFPKTVKKVLYASSGSGDWTATKNRSDEDRAVETFVELAKRNPNIQFIYRCHPVWIVPVHQGVKSIQRVIDYFEELNLPNLQVSSNIPSAFQDGKMVLSYKRSSLEEDLKDVDIIFGEHSISMIDGAFKQIPFCSVNVTGHRAFFKSINDLGFPHCESVDELNIFLKNITTEDYQKKYLAAVERYNEMTDEE